MGNLLACVYEKVILLLSQLETGGSENIDSFADGLWAAHGAADLQGTLFLFFCIVKPLYEQFFDWNCYNGIFFIRIS